jgi:hypothetical protein
MELDCQPNQWLQMVEICFCESQPRRLRHIGNVLLGTGMQRIGAASITTRAEALDLLSRVLTSGTIWLGIGSLIAFFVRLFSTTLHAGNGSTNLACKPDARPPTRRALSVSTGEPIELFVGDVTEYDFPIP